MQAKSVFCCTSENMACQTVTSSPSYLSIKLDSQDGVGVGVVADLSSLLEVTDFEFPWSLQADDGHQAAGEQALHNAHILCVCWQGHTHKHTKDHFICTGEFFCLLLITLVVTV